MGEKHKEEQGTCEAVWVALCKRKGFKNKYICSLPSLRIVPLKCYTVKNILTAIIQTVQNIKLNFVQVIL